MNMFIILGERYFILLFASLMGFLAHCQMGFISLFLGQFDHETLLLPLHFFRLIHIVQHQIPMTGMEQTPTVTPTTDRAPMIGTGAMMTGSEIPIEGHQWMILTGKDFDNA